MPPVHRAAVRRPHISPLPHPAPPTSCPPPVLTCADRARAACRFVKYNLVLRGSSALVPHFVDEFERLCSGNKYVTSLHACNSAVVKLGKLTSAAIVYRGVSGLLPEAFWTPNRWGVCGGVENGFMSTTLDRQVAMAYAASGAASTVYEIRMGSECRLAPLNPRCRIPRSSAPQGWEDDV